MYLSIWKQYSNSLNWQKSPIFKKVSGISDISALSKEERIKYEHTKKPIVTISACTNTNTRLAIRKDLWKGIRKAWK